MITILYSQSIIDIAIQEYGTAQASFQLAMANGLSITDKLTAGQKLVALVKPNYLNTDIQKYYKNKGIQPATAVAGYTEQENGGIGEMIINQTFIVS